jgi:UDP-N-acetylmuramoyl-tripeptide--D-alanyl-D-alanine ligase
MIRLTVAELAEITGGRIIGDASVEVFAGVETDSRRIGPGFLFVAKPGEVTDGHLFIASAAAAGATAALVQREVEQDIPVVVVDDVVVALGQLATAVIAKLRELGNLTVIGVTGSNGKTSTKNMLNAVLSQFGNTIAPRESFNNEVGAPISMLLANESTRFLVVELGADGLGSIDYLAKMCRPDIGVELKVGMAHAGEFGGIEVTAKIKAELMANIREGGVLVFNADDGYCVDMAAGFGGRKVSFGTSESDYRAIGSRVSLSGTHSTLVYPDHTESEISLRILGEHQIMNALATIAVADSLGLDRVRVLEVLAELPLAERWRMQLKEQDGIAVINDAYNASPESMRAALQTLATLGRETGRRTVAVLGEMAELGIYSAESHDSMGRLVVRLNIDQLIVVGSGAKLIHMGATQEGSWDGESKFFESIDESFEHVRGMLRSNDIVLVKSSKSANLRHLGDKLMGVEE